MGFFAFRTRRRSARSPPVAIRLATSKKAAVKKYVVKLSDEERERLNTLVHTGKRRAGQLVKARILLRADASEAGEGWSDSEIAAALDTSVTTVARTRQH